MCGLYASIGFEPDPARIDIVAHRGPDGRGWLTFASAAGPVAIGHRRLAIIDVTDAGHQPMADPSERFHIVFNGEIYNYVELRDELRARGETFQTASDTEVLLRAYTVWGETCLQRLRGMFAFVIWDDREKSLFAARDRFGIKPLYITGGETGYALASEIKQLCGLPSVTGRMNVPRVHDFLSRGIADHTSQTMFEGISQLRGGECLSIATREGFVTAQIRRWYPVSADTLTLSAGEAADRYRALLADAVRVHLRSDVPVGSCLSGGLDSSSIVCLMAGMMPPSGSITTVSACYAEKAVDEKPFMEAVVEKTKANPRYIYPRADDVFQQASDITWHQDEPFGSTSIFAQWCVFAEARRAGVKVMLDGQGADEQLAGYHFCFPYYVSHLARGGRFFEIGRAMREWRALHGTPLTTQAVNSFLPLLPDNLVGSLRRLHQSQRQFGWLETGAIACGNPSSAESTAAKELGLSRPTDLRFLCLAMTFASNLQMLLHWEDRNSMAHSIEARVPFLDHPVVEFALALGNDHKIVRGSTKSVLRQAMSGILPEKIALRHDKLGFQTPESIWFRGPLRGHIQDGVETTLKLVPDLLDAKAVRRWTAAMLDGTRFVDPALWRIVNLGIWAKRFSVTL